MAKVLLGPLVLATLVLGGGPVPPSFGDEPPGPPPPAPASRTQDPQTRLQALDREFVGRYGAGDLAGATRVAREMLAICESASGPAKAQLPQCLANLSWLLVLQAEHAEARALQERALALREAAHGPDHPEVARSLATLARIDVAEGRYAEAVARSRRALGIDEAVLAPDDPTLAEDLDALGTALQASGSPEEARAVFERSVRILERAHGKVHPQVAAAVTNLALVVEDLGDYPAARRLHERALATFERALGKDDPQVATALNNLAACLLGQGAYAAARPLFERALEIVRKALGPGHPSVAGGLGNLAALLAEQGAFSEARPLYERALALDEAAFGPEHPDVANDCHNLAALLLAQGDAETALPLVLRARKIREKALGEGHPLLGRTLGLEATVRAELGSGTEALPLLERALAIAEGALGGDHPDVADALAALGSARDAAGDPEAARSAHERALEIRRRALGEEHPDVAASLLALARHHEGRGDSDAALPAYERALALTEGHVRASLGGLTAPQRLASVRLVRRTLDAWIAFAPKAGRSGYEESLRLRGLVARAEAAERALARRADEGVRALWTSLGNVERLAARLANDVPPASDAALRGAWQRRYAETLARRERLALDLSARSAALRGAQERLDLRLADVRRVLGPGAALVDFLRTGDVYVAWVLRHDGEPVRVDLGPAEPVEEACAAFLAAIAADGGEPEAKRLREEAGARLRARVWAPAAAHLGPGIRRVVLAPDAALASVPFAALPGERPGTWLLDDVGISHVMHASDLVPPHRDAPPSRRSLVVGGVDYDRAEAEAPPAKEVRSGTFPGPGERAPAGGAFTPLEATRPEAEALAARLGAEGTTLLFGAAASEARLRALAPGCRYLHVATHGFAREDLLAGLYVRRIREAWTTEAMERVLGGGHDPMLLSGLALAGANGRRGGGEDDGILTALEASRLDLEGTDLVTLSACETARGTAASGEGVLGLVLGFRMAGAHRVIASLWKVDDVATRTLMEGAYERMLRPNAPLSPAESLREAARALRDGADASGARPFAPPRYWAAFVVYGP